MNQTKRPKILPLLVAALLFSTRAVADPMDFTFTGIGINGAQASGTFTTEGNLAPFYFATGGIFSAFALTITGIPGGGPSSASFDAVELASSWLQVDGSGAIFIAPYGSHNYGGPFFDHYDLGQPAQPGYPSSFTFVTDLSYDGRYLDTITWSVATPAISTSTVPDAGSTSVMLLGSMLLLAAGSRRRVGAR